jgi:Flp pilus assembly protein TadD
VIVLAAATWARNVDYRTELSIMTDTVAKRPHNTRALTNLGVALVRAGRMEEAVPHLERAVGLNPRQADAHFNLAMIRAEQRRWAEAEEHLRRVVELEPGNERARAAWETVRRMMR